MKKLAFFLGALLVIGTAGSALGAEFKFNGDLNNRFNLYTNQAQMFNGVENVRDTFAATGGVLDDGDIEEFWGDAKYRLQAEMSTNDGRAKGVYAVELGAIRYGVSGRGGGYSGDGINIETRFAYTDFALTDNVRVTLGLQPFKVNKYVWSETAMGVQLKTTAGPAGLTFAWMRGKEEFFNDDEDDNLFDDHDALLARGDFKLAETGKLGAFVLYQRANTDEDGGATNIGYEIKQWTGVEYDLVTLGVDGSFNIPTGIGNFFVNADAMMQTGDFESTPAAIDADFKGFFLHADVGTTVGATRFTYTTWYASGMEDDDDDYEAFIATDVDTFDSVIFFEGGYTDDNYFTEAPYILNKGMFFNKIAVDHKVSDKLTFGGALIYAMLAEDIALPDGSEDDTLGLEVDGYISYKLYPNLELAANFGYLFADDAMAAWETDGDGSSDVDPYRITARARYSF